MRTDNLEKHLGIDDYRINHSFDIEQEISICRLRELAMTMGSPRTCKHKLAIHSVDNNNEREQAEETNFLLLFLNIYTGLKLQFFT